MFRDNDILLARVFEEYKSFWKNIKEVENDERPNRLVIGRTERNGKEINAVMQKKRLLYI